MSSSDLLSQNFTSDDEDGDFGLEPNSLHKMNSEQVQGREQNTAIHAAQNEVDEDEDEDEQDEDEEDDDDEDVVW